MVVTALILGGMAAWNAAALWFFVSYFPARWDALPVGEIPEAAPLLPYTVSGPDTIGLV